jgi:hypothetical protein
VKVVDASLGGAYFDYLSSGAMDFGGKLELGLPKTSDPDHQPVYIGGTINGWVDGNRAFDAEAAVAIRLMGWNLAGGQLLVSNVAIAGCGNITPWLEGGFAYTWADKQFALMSGACDLSAYRPAMPAGLGTAVDVAAGHAAAADSRSLRLTGAGTRILKLVGAGASPQVVVRGPGGEQVSTPANGRPLIGGQFVVLQDPTSDTTYVAIHHAAGVWRVTPVEGTRLRSVLVASPLPKPIVHATVGRSGRYETLRYRIQAPVGTHVRFAEIGPETHQVLGTVSGRRGTLRFIPGIGPAGHRRIVAIITENGAPFRQLEVAGYTAAGSPSPTAPRGLAVRHQGRSLVVSWLADPKSVRGYEVRLDVKDGPSRMLYLAPGHNTAVFTNAAAPTDIATITVEGVGADGHPGTPSRLTIPNANAGHPKQPHRKNRPRRSKH